MANHCLEAGYECIIYDPEGLGMSSGYFSTVEFDHWMEDCQVAARQTDNRKLVLVAPSMGAIIAVRMAQQSGERVVGIVMAAPAITVFESNLRYW